MTTETVISTDVEHLPRFVDAVSALAATKHCCATVLEDLLPGRDYNRPEKSDEPPTTILPEWLVGAAAALWRFCLDNAYSPRIDYRIQVEESGAFHESFALTCHRPHGPKDICGNEYAHAELQKVVLKSRALLLKGIVPRLRIIHAGNKPDDLSYRVQIQRAAANIGVLVDEIELDEHPTPDDLRARLHWCNQNSDIGGVLVQTIRDKAVDEAIRNALSKNKDPELIDKRRMGELASVAAGEEIGAPVTAMSVRALLHEGFGGRANVKGKRILVVNGGLVIGAPAVLLLGRADGATIVWPTSNTPLEELRQDARRADGIIIATGRRGLLRPEDIKPGAVVVDAGIINLDGRIVGDLDYAAIKEVAGRITPVPGGVGPVTTAFLLRNLLNQLSEHHRCHH